MSERFVRVDVYTDEGERREYRAGYAWGLLNDDHQFRWLWARSKKAREICETNDVDGGFTLYDCEQSTVVDADKVWTPNCVYVALAKRVLLGEDENDDEND